MGKAKKKNRSSRGSAGAEQREEPDSAIFDVAVEGMTQKSKLTREETIRKVYAKLSQTFDPAAIEHSCESLLDGIIRGIVKKGGFNDAMTIGARSIGCLHITAAGLSESEAINLETLWRLMFSCNQLRNANRYSRGTGDALLALSLGCFTGCESEGEAVALMSHFERRIRVWGKEWLGELDEEMGDYDSEGDMPLEMKDESLETLSQSLSSVIRSWSLVGSSVRPGFTVVALRERIGDLLVSLLSFDSGDDNDDAVHSAAAEALGLALECGLGDDDQANNDEEIPAESIDEDELVDTRVSLRSVAYTLAHLASVSRADYQDEHAFRRDVACEAAFVFDDEDREIELDNGDSFTILSARQALQLRILRQMLGGGTALRVHLAENPFVRDLFDLGPLAHVYSDTLVDQDARSEPDMDSLSFSDRSVRKSAQRQAHSSAEKNRYLTRSAHRRPRDSVGEED